MSILKNLPNLELDRISENHKEEKSKIIVDLSNSLPSSRQIKQLNLKPPIA